MNESRPRDEHARDIAKLYVTNKTWKQETEREVGCTVYSNIPDELERQIANYNKHVGVDITLEEVQAALEVLEVFQ